MRRVRCAGQILAVQVKQRRAAQFDSRLLNLIMSAFKLKLLHKHPHKTIKRRLAWRGIYKTQAVGGKFNNLHGLSLFLSIFML